MTHPTNYTLTSGSWYSHKPYNQFTRAWQAAEAYLDVGAKSYRVSDLETLELSEDRYSFTTWGDTALRIIKAVSHIVLFPLALGALAIRTYYRSKWRVSEHLATYKGISTFTLTPPGKPIPSLAELQAKQQAMQPSPPPAAPKSRPPAPTQQHLPFVDSFDNFPIHQPQQQPQPAPTTISLGTQFAGNDHVRVMQRNSNADLPLSGSTVTDIDGYNCLYIRGNNNTDFLIRRN